MSVRHLMKRIYNQHEDYEERERKRLTQSFKFMAMGCGISKVEFRHSFVFADENVFINETGRDSANKAVTNDNESLLKIQRCSSTKSKTDRLEEKGKILT